MSSGFISEVELAEQRKTRQEEWDKVRTAEQPTEVPDEKFDHRSLYDRLQEQKNKRDMEYEEAHKLSDPRGIKRKLSDAEGSLQLLEPSKPSELCENTVMIGTLQNGAKLSGEIYNPSALKCIGVLPGLGPYDESSDSECSSDSDHEHDHVKYDLLGREVTMEKENKS